MPTTVVSTIGTGGDYTTLAAWEAASPADLVTADQVWEGQALNQEFVGTSTLLTIAGQTVDATRYIHLTAAPGASFADNASKLTNALRYDAANGAGIRQTVGYAGAAVIVSTAYTRISKLQIAATAGLEAGLSIGAANVQVEQVIALGRHVGCNVTGAGVVARNCLFISSAAPRNDSAALIITSGSISAYNCTGVTYSNVTPGVLSSAFLNSYASMLLKNCAGFGFPYFSRPSAISASSSNNASDQTIAVGTGNKPSLTYADQFHNTTSGAADFRTKAGAALIANGADLSGVGVTVDIVGAARSMPYGISAWQAASTPPITGGSIVAIPPGFGYPQPITGSPPNPAISA